MRASIPFELRGLSALSDTLRSLVEGRLWLKVLLGLALGLLVGAALGPTTGWVSADVGKTVTSWLALPGNIFLRLVQMIMLPLVVSSVIQGIAGRPKGGTLEGLGLRVGVYFLVTTLVSVGIGVAVALLVRPGKGFAGAAFHVDKVASPRLALDVPSGLVSVLPANPLAAMVSGEMLSIVVFSIIVGLAVAALPIESATPVLRMLGAVQEICMTITRWVMRIVPFAVFGLISQVTARVGLESIARLSIYVLTVLLALLVIVAFNMVALRVWGKHSMIGFMRAVREVLLLAFSVSSSAAVMPLTLKTAEEKLGVSPAIARFIIPLGTTVNMSGTAAYQAVATLFLADVYGIELTLASLALLLVTTVAASIGTPSAPGAGIVLLSTVLGSMGIPVEGIALIIGVDSLLGMFRTAVNVTVDLVAVVLFDARSAPRGT